MTNEKTNFQVALEENIQGTRHAIKFIAQFVSALLKTRTSNLAKIANAFETERQLKILLD